MLDDTDRTTSEERAALRVKHSPVVPRRVWPRPEPYGGFIDLDEQALVCKECGEPWRNGCATIRLLDDRVRALGLMRAAERDIDQLTEALSKTSVRVDHHRNLFDQTLRVHTMIDETALLTERWETVLIHALKTMMEQMAGERRARMQLAALREDERRSKPAAPLNDGEVPPTLGTLDADSRGC